MQKEKFESTIAICVLVILCLCIWLRGKYESEIVSAASVGVVANCAADVQVKSDYLQVFTTMGRFSVSEKFQCIANAALLVEVKRSGISHLCYRDLPLCSVIVVNMRDYKK